MARAFWSGFLSFGLVNVPVGLYTATTDQTVHFNQLHKGTSHRIRYKKVDEVTGEEVDNDDIVSGYDLGGGEYVVVSKDELKAMAPGRSDTIDITDFVDLDRIDPIYFKATYYLAPHGKGADRAYALLRQAMRESNKVGVATFVLRDKEHLVAVRPGEDVLILETMFFADEIREPREELDTLPSEVAFQGRELVVAKQLIESLTTDWNPESYHATYRERVRELIDEKRKGHAIVQRAEKPKSNVIDLMAALEASVSKGGRGRAADEEAEEDGARSTASSAKHAASGDDEVELESLSKAELMERAAEAEIEGRSKMTKPELVKALTAASTGSKGRGRRVS